jgi:dTDP-L-rhamnose 4-epimerase
MGQHVLVVGGAGFVGSHVVTELLGSGHRVRVLDNLQSALHAKERGRAWHAAEAELVVGDVRDDVDIRRALRGIDAVAHVVSDATPAGEPSNLGIFMLLSALRDQPVAKLVIASSLAVYDEGIYRIPNAGLTGVEERSAAQLASGCWEPWSRPGETLLPWPTPEGFVPKVPSARARFHRFKEHLCLEFGRVQGTAVCALRLAHVYGRGRLPSHPRASVLCGFGARMLDGTAPLVFEDGQQRRDFVSAYDVARAFRLALES